MLISLPKKKQKRFQNCRVRKLCHWLSWKGPPSTFPFLMGLLSWSRPAIELKSNNSVGFLGADMEASNLFSFLTYLLFSVTCFLAISLLLKPSIGEMGRRNKTSINHLFCCLGVFLGGRLGIRGSWNAGQKEILPNSVAFLVSCYWRRITKNWYIYFPRKAETP